ncbi:Hypothetical protein GL50581_1819 [Giardia duodenalis ATCC 50581]|uniref:Uncharacterized protein n=1 Tax=Giardia intestinalis (strain ATCC 50581 / GS clone H7) TaxID=598745 RepID=C6LSS6_GIAIB|nr:Hypothetical protein GL50581_1819 [Giardia intestinalis ATCC 50581]
MNRIFNPQGIREAPCFDRRERSLQRHTNIENLSDFDYRSPLPLTKDAFPTTKSTDTYRTDLMNLSMTPDESLNKAVYHETLRSSIASTSKRNRNVRSHYGPSYYRRGYYNEELAEMLVDRMDTLAYIGAEGYKGPNVREQPSYTKTRSQLRAISAGQASRVPELPGFTRKPYTSTKPSYISPGTEKTYVHAFREQTEIKYFHTGVFKCNPVTNEQQWSCCGSSTQGDPGCMKRVSRPNKVNYELTFNRICN